MNFPTLPRVAVLVTCFNRVQVTLPNIGALMAALDKSNVSYDVHLLDDASPDGTGAKVHASYPQVNVQLSEGNLFWNRGMHRIYLEARRHGPYDGYLLFNDDVAVDAEAVVRFVDRWVALNDEQPTTLVGATLATDGSKTTYSAYRVLSRHRPLNLTHIEPGAGARQADTFNANFVLVPGPTLDEFGGTDPHYWHGYGDIDLGLSILRKGQRLLLSEGWIGRCDVLLPLRRSRHGLFRRLRLGLTGRNDPRQHAYLVWKHAENRAIAVLVILAMLAKRIRLLVANGPHLLSSSPDARD
jgi:GT2 family glycosyltransferase